MTINDLYRLIQKRKTDMPKSSYTASLFRLGTDRIAQKVGEEAIEVVIAAKNENRQRIIEEGADLLFHLFVLCADKTITLNDILRELRERQK